MTKKLKISRINSWFRCILIFLFSLAIIPDNVFAQSNAKIIFLVRHAEKAEDIAGDRNPSLNEAGLLRAEHLAEMLSTADIKLIYSTDFKRTTETGLPLANLLGITIKKYDSRAPDALNKILSETDNARILIIGHSNTVPKMVNELLGSEKYPLLGEEEYDKLFMITKYDDHADCIVIRY